ncbi:PepSY domain-containing protein [Ureibacillus sp. MALMAid1270]|uniref:PepSY domain-containing protein n=1 Tax=Ureibacillus sp. MALMAid1270 TaxID=3411629 RepID=UPI003BA7D12B
MGIGGIIAVASGSLVGFASELTVEEIKEKALAEVNGTIHEVEFEKEGSKTFYEIEIVTEDAEYV